MKLSPVDLGAEALRPICSAIQCMHAVRHGPHTAGLTCFVFSVCTLVCFTSYCGKNANEIHHTCFAGSNSRKENSRMKGQGG